MVTFDVTLNGYDAATDETDDLVKWVKAPDETTVQDYLTAVGLIESVQSIREMHGRGDLMPADGIDLILMHGTGTAKYRVVYPKDAQQQAAMLLKWKDQVYLAAGTVVKPGDLPPSLLAAIKEVINYNWQEELQDAEENGAEGHIFSHLVVLDNFVEGVENTPESHFEGEDVDEDVEEDDG